jgi:hypothetical protein
MSRSGWRCPLAAATALLLAGVLLNSAHLDLAGGSRSADAPGAAAAVEAAPLAVVPVVGGVRDQSEAALASLVRSSKSPLPPLLLAALLGLVPLVRACWCLSRPDRRVAAPPGRSTLAPLRAPPVAR